MKMRQMIKAVMPFLKGMLAGVIFTLTVIIALRYTPIVDYGICDVIECSRTFILTYPLIASLFTLHDVITLALLIGCCAIMNRKGTWFHRWIYPERTDNE